MFLFCNSKKTNKNIKLLGAMQLRDTAVLVCKKDGQVCLESGQEGKIQKNLLSKMLDLNPRIRKILHNFKIKPVININALKGFPN